MTIAINKYEMNNASGCGDAKTKPLRPKVAEQPGPLVTFFLLIECALYDC